MINDLRYAVSFPTNGIALSGVHSFQPGATAVSGRNGKGKSFIAEMVRYGLFGKKALRGPASDYKQLNMALTFTVGDEAYQVTRGKKEILYLDEEALAVGADAVNKKVIDILGFGLEVFDVVCSANQKESERLSRLTPAKRKELIDEVVGLTAQESVEKACRDEANGLRREAEALTRALVLPVEPTRPVGYRPSKEIAAELADTKAIVARREELERIIARVGIKPTAPDKAEVDTREIEKHEGVRIANDAHYTALLRQMGAIPAPLLTTEQIKEAEALAAYDADIARRGQKPDYDQGYLDEQLELLVAQELLAHDSVSCPKCSHEFDPRDPETDRTALAALPAPALTRAEIIKQSNRISLWQDTPTEPKGTRLAPADIRSAQLALDRADEKEKLRLELEGMKLLPDRSAELVEGRQLGVAWSIYRQQRQEYDERALAAHAAQTELAKLSVPKVTLAELDAAFVAARVYETQVDSYAELKQRFDELSATIGEKQERSEGFAAGAKGLVEARRTLKAFLAPSLSRVASATIQQMTAAADRPLYAIVIDEDMNITVDGQDVSTFNGAHATMINLALRLALGQVLVSRVMPLFIGDEIDSDLDEANSQMLVDALLSLKDQLKQVIVISHKQLEGFDEEIVL